MHVSLNPLNTYSPARNSIPPANEQKSSQNKHHRGKFMYNGCATYSSNDRCVLRFFRCKKNAWYLGRCADFNSRQAQGVYNHTTTHTNFGRSLVAYTARNKPIAYPPHPVLYCIMHLSISVSDTRVANRPS